MSHSGMQDQKSLEAASLGNGKLLKISDDSVYWRRLIWTKISRLKPVKNNEFVVRDHLQSQTLPFLRSGQVSLPLGAPRLLHL